MIEAYIPRFEVVGQSRKRLQEVNKGSSIIKDGKPRKSRIIGGYNRTATQRYVPLVELDESGFDPTGLPHVTQGAALNILADSAISSSRLTTAFKRKTTIPFSPTVKDNNRPHWESKLPLNATPYMKEKMREIALRNEIKRKLLNREITFYQLALVLWGMGYFSEPNITEPELPIRPFPKEKLENLNPRELAIMEKKYSQRILAITGKIYPR